VTTTATEGGRRAAETDPAAGQRGGAGFDAGRARSGLFLACAQVTVNRLWPEPATIWTSSAVLRDTGHHRSRRALGEWRRHVTFEPLADVFPDRQKLVSAAIFTTAALLVS
jgi:hypothetical protein